MYKESCSMPPESVAPSIVIEKKLAFFKSRTVVFVSTSEIKCANVLPAYQGPLPYLVYKAIQ